MTSTIPRTTPSGDDADDRVATYQRMILDVAKELAAHFDAVRLPIHILLEHRFGELNENQEEMLEAARTSADVAGESIRKLRELVELELGRLQLSPTRQRPDDLFRSVATGVTADARRRGVELSTSVRPPMPPISVDAVRVREALTLLVAEAIRSAADAVVEFTARATRDEVVFDVVGSIRVDGVDARLALALLAAQHARVDVTPCGVTVIFPVPAMDRLAPPISIV